MLLLKSSMMDKVFLWLLLFVPIAAFAAFFHASATTLFFLSALAIIPLAKYIGQATEELATRTSTAVGGLLNVTFGNATELIIGIFALHAGLIQVVKASITGSIIGNLLLVLGTAMVAGGAIRKKQTFNRAGAMAGGSTLFLAAAALVIPAVLLISAPTTSAASIEHLSILVAICLIILYLASLFFSLVTHKHLYTGEAGEEESGWSLSKSVWILLGATLGVAWMSDMLVGTIDTMGRTLGWTDLFIGVVIIAIVGNAAEHASAVTMAVKDKMDLALQIGVGSATQMAMFVAPVFVFVSLLFRNQMTLVFDTFEITSIFLSILLVNLVIADGESNWLEGAQLLVAYAIIAIAFFVHP
jgi:Ca2+:H+ antiporter